MQRYFNYAGIKPEVHFEHPWDDRTLCGLALEGDDEIEPLKETTWRANCTDCIRLVDHCKGISNAEIERE